MQKQWTISLSDCDMPWKVDFIGQLEMTSSVVRLRRSSIILVQSLNRVRLYATPWTAACHASLSITNPEFTQTHVHRVGDAIQPSHPLSSPSPSALNLSQHQGLFKWVSSSHQVATELELQLQHQSFQLIFRIDFLRIDWLDLLPVQGTLKSLLQHHSSKVSILWHSAFFIVQLSHPCMTIDRKSVV